MKRLAIWMFATAGLLLTARDMVLAAKHKTLYPKPTTIRPRKSKKIKWQLREDVQA